MPIRCNSSSPWVRHKTLKGCLRFLYFNLFWMSQNLAKYSYGWLPLEQHHKIENKTLADPRIQYFTNQIVPYSQTVAQKTPNWWISSIRAMKFSKRLIYIKKHTTHCKFHAYHWSQRSHKLLIPHVVQQRSGNWGKPLASLSSGSPHHSLCSKFQHR